MKKLMQVLMLTIVLFALTSAPATVDYTQGLGGAIAELVLTAPVVAQDAGDGEEECTDWCLVRSDGMGIYCEKNNQGADPGNADSGPHAECETEFVECPEPGFDGGDCTKCNVTFIDPSCDPAGNDGDGGQFAGFGIAPSGMIVANAEMLLVHTSDGLLRTRCGGYVVGALRVPARPTRLVI